MAWHNERTGAWAYRSVVKERAVRDRTWTLDSTYGPAATCVRRGKLPEETTSPSSAGDKLGIKKTRGRYRLVVDRGRVVGGIAASMLARLDLTRG